MKRNRILIYIFIAILFVASGIYYVCYISFTDNLAVKRNNLSFWLLIPTVLRDLPEIEGKRPVYFHSPGEGTKPVSITILYEDIKNSEPAVAFIRKYLSGRGVSIAGSDKLNTGNEEYNGNSAYEAYIDIYREKAGYEDVRIMAVYLD